MRKIFTVLVAVALCVTMAAGLISSAEREVDNRSAKKATSAKITPQESALAQKNVPPAATNSSTTPTQVDLTETQTPSGLKMTGEQINWYVISSGATNASSTNYQLQGTVGQLAVGDASSTNYTVKSGYWQDFGAGGGCCVQRGNVNALGGIDIADLTYLVNYMFKSGPNPPCEEEGNVNALGSIDIADLTYLVNFMFKSGPNPPPC